MKQLVVVGISALSLGVAGGYLAGKSGDEKSTATTTGNETRRSRGDSGTTSSSNSTAKDKKSGRNVESILTMSGHQARTQALMDLYAGMTTEQLSEESQKLSRLPMEQRMMASMLLYGRWAEIDPTGALAQVNKMGWEGGMLRPTVMQSWASTDPAAAARYFSENPRLFQGGGPGGNSSSTIASEWAKLDPEAALSWANSLTTGQDKSGALASVIREMAAKDPTKAVQAAAALTGDEQIRSYREIASQWGASDFNAAKAWIDSLPAESRDQALASALSTYASSDPVKASSEIASMPDGDSKDRAIERVAQAWATTDPAAAAAWVLKQGGENTDGAIRGVMSNWATQNPTAALSFIQAQPQGELRDEAVSSYIMSNRTADPASSVALAESISDEGDRNRTLGMTAARWMQEDPVAAKEYVEKSTALSDRAKEMILSGRGGGWGGGGPGGFGGRGR